MIDVSDAMRTIRHGSRFHVHAHDVAQLLAPVANTKCAAFFDLFEHLLLPLGILHLHLLYLVHQPRDITHPQHTTDEGLRPENLNIGHVLAETDEEDRRLGGGHSRDGTATFGVAIELGDKDTAVSGSLLESPTLSLCCLTNASIENHDRLVRCDGLADLNHFTKELAFLLVPARRVNNDDFEFGSLEGSNTCRGNRNRVCLGMRTIEGEIDFRSILLELVEGTRPERVRTHEACLEAALVVVICQLGA